MAVGQGNKVLASDIASLFTTLNTIRAKFSLGALPVPERITPGQTMYASDVQTLATYMTNTSTSTKYIPSKTYTISGVVRGYSINSGFVSIAQSDLNQMNAQCVNDYNCSDDSDDNDSGCQTYDGNFVQVNDCPCTQCNLVMGTHC